MWNSCYPFGYFVMFPNCKINKCCDSFHDYDVNTYFTPGINWLYFHVNLVAIKGNTQQEEMLTGSLRRSLSSRHLRRSLKETRRWVWCWWLHEEELLAEQKYLKSWFKDDSHNLASSGHFLSFGLGASLSWVWQSRLLYFPLVVCILAKPHHPWES